MQKNKTLETEQGFAFNPSRTEVALFWIYDEVQKKKKKKRKKNLPRPLGLRRMWEARAVGDRRRVGVTENLLNNNGECW